MRFSFSNMPEISLAPILIPLLILAGVCCGTNSAVDSGDDEQDLSGNDPFTDIRLGPVAADGQLETVTWNLEWYGVRGNGPENEYLQTVNILTVIDSLKADLYAFQEVHETEDLQRITGSMEGYRGFVAEFMDRQNQRTAFVYNSAAIDSVSAGPITEGQDAYAWASGRFPFYFEFNYRYNGTLTPIYAVVIHAKAFDDEASYQRRRQAAENLYSYLSEHKPGARIIFMGDYNDDVDRSIYEGAVSPYEPFVSDGQHYRVITKVLSDNGVSSTVFYPEMVDHITISDELFGNLVEQSEEVFLNAESFIEEYGATTSDHYPVWAKFDFR